MKGGWGGKYENSGNLLSYSKLPPLWFFCSASLPKQVRYQAALRPDLLHLLGGLAVSGPA